MKKILYILMLILLPVQLQAVTVGIYDLKVENLRNPLGIDVSVPRFSWKLSCDRNNTLQTSYQLLVASSRELLDKGEGNLWNSGVVSSAEQLWISYQGKSLNSNDEAFWKVRVVTNQGASDWSEVQHFSMGLLNETHWKGRWIGLEELQSDECRGMHTRLSARYLRKTFKARSAVRRATAYVAGFGLDEFYVNGQRMGNNQVLKPAPADFRKTIYYNTYDITSFLNSNIQNKEQSKENKNETLGIILTSGRVFPMRQEKYYKSPVFGLPKCRINVIVEYADGTTETWVTDQTWKLNASGPIRNANEYDGEEYDARMEFNGWNQNGYDDTKWSDAVLATIPDGMLRAQMTPCMVSERYGTPVSVHPLSSSAKQNSVILDFGQNMAGWIGMKV